MVTVQHCTYTGMKWPPVNTVHQLNTCRAGGWGKNPREKNTAHRSVALFKRLWHQSCVSLFRYLFHLKFHTQSLKDNFACLTARNIWTPETALNVHGRKADSKCKNTTSVKSTFPSSGISMTTQNKLLTAASAQGEPRALTHVSTTQAPTVVTSRAVYQHQYIRHHRHQRLSF